MLWVMCNRIQALLALLFTLRLVQTDCIPIRSKIENSVTRRADCFFNIWPFTMMKFCPKAYKIGEILPNLVTLIENSLTGHILFIRYIGLSPFCIYHNELRTSERVLLHYRQTGHGTNAHLIKIKFVYHIKRNIFGTEII